MKAPRAPRWSDEELSFLVDNYKDKKAGWIAAKLGRTVLAVQTRAKIIGLFKSSKTRYEAKEIEIMIENYASKGPEWCSREIGRSLTQTYAFARDLGLYCNTRPQWIRWTDEHDNILRTFYHRKGAEWCAAKLERTPKSVIARAFKIGLSKKRA